MSEENQEKFEEEDINSIIKIRELWDLINYDINFWIEIAKKKAQETPELNESWNLLGDILWKMSPSIEEALHKVENLIAIIRNNQGDKTEETAGFYSESGQVIMQIALVIKITDTLKQMAKPEKPLTIEETNKLIEAINCPLNSKHFQTPLEIIQKEMNFRGM